jgi:hypothetical protein
MLLQEKEYWILQQNTLKQKVFCCIGTESSKRLIMIHLQT